MSLLTDDCAEPFSRRHRLVALIETIQSSGRGECRCNVAKTEKIMSVWKSLNGQKQNEVRRLRVSLAGVSRRRMRAGWDEQMLQLLLVSHINREQMATGRRRGRETETERAVGRGTAWSRAWWRSMSLQTPGGEDSLLIQCETNVSKHRQVQNRDRGRDLHNHWDVCGDHFSFKLHFN